MSYFNRFFWFLLYALPVLVFTEPPAGWEWELVWQDEFDGTELDGSKWEALSGSRRNAIMDPDDAYLDGKGNLVIRTRKVGDEFHDGFIRTRGRYEPTYGYFECRCKLPKEEGHWAAFWLHGRQVCAGCPGVEVDIMEYPFRDNTTVQNLHWDGYGSEHKHDGSGHLQFEGSLDDYHTFAVDWTPDEYIFYINGEESWRSDAKVSQVPGYIKLTDEVGDWAGDIWQASLPDYFMVDYVRVYKKGAPISININQEHYSGHYANYRTYYTVNSMENLSDLLKTAPGIFIYNVKGSRRLSRTRDLYPLPGLRAPSVVIISNQ